ncbi:hypothetical protein KAJ61_03105 [Candidatus Parcubacteria bacterium]|nr:hypothetical protein [Candidatus Parcubacteria bacterium]
MEYKKHKNRDWIHLMSVPIIYGMSIPLVFFDITLEIYHNICFRLYGISLVKRSKYIKIDRHKLRYLNWIDKINCAYCGYANGLVNYARTIAAETEKYWCGIKHKNDNNFIEPKHHKDFLDYGDEEGLKKKFN